MKKIFYICTKPVEDWDIFLSHARKETSQNNISLLFLHKGQSLKDASVSQVWYVGESKQDEGEENTKKYISYQDFLEQIFSHDLSVVL